MIKIKRKTVQAIGYIAAVMGGVAWLIFTIILLTSCNQAQADTWVDVHIASKHSDQYYIADSGKSERINELNFGIGIAYAANDNIELIAGFYENSSYNTSFYAGGDIHTASRRSVRAGVSVGIVTGYKNDIGLAFMPNVVFQTLDAVRIKIGYIPETKYNRDALTVSIGVKI